jgi:hypothetical protein
MAGNTDTDMGLEAIFKEIEVFKNSCVKVGVTEDVGGTKGDGDATVAEYAAWNEMGVMGPPVSEHGEPGGWFIPPRPFIRGFVDAKREQIGKTIERLYGQVNDGKMFAKTALGRLGQFGESGIKSYIRTGDFRPNAERTKKRKKSSKPLIDTGTLRNSIRFQVIDKPAEEVSEE